MLRIKPGYGYWDITNYPIGGCFRRADRDGAESVIIIDTTAEIEPSYKGVNRRGKSADGRLIAWHSEHAEQIKEVINNDAI